MNNKKLIILFLIFAIINNPINSHADDNKLRIVPINNHEYISLNELTREIDIYNSFDIITGRGQLFYKGSVAVYQAGFSVILVNNRLYRSEYPVIRPEGELFFPVIFVKHIITGFYQKYTISESNGYLSLNKSKTEIIPPGKTAAEKITFIIIDPGHGGKDPGALGKGGLQEKWITLKISKLLEEYLRKNIKNVTVKMTRETDRFIELDERTNIANRMLKRNQNGIFLSIHVNASISPSISGFETYFLSQNPSNEEARTTATLENNVIVIYEDEKKKEIYNDIRHIEAIMLNTQIQKESLMLANIIQKKMDANISEYSSRGVKKADFNVLRGSLMPAVLIEVGYITNKKEAKSLNQSVYQKKIAKGIGDGVINFIEEYNKMIK